LLFLFDTFDRHDAEAGDIFVANVILKRLVLIVKRLGVVIRDAVLFEFADPQRQGKQSALEEASETDSPRAS
jgi:hypothetical protein